MNRLIGITGGMASGKTTLAYKILLANPDYVYFDVDVFRRNLFFNQSYIDELKKVIPELTSYSEINSTILNKYIYRNPYYMKAYKDILYRYLFNYLNSFNNKTILIDWALILNDNLQDKFDKIIYLDVSETTRLTRLKNSDLPIEEILKRFKLQRLENLNNYNNLLIVDLDERKKCLEELKRVLKPNGLIILVENDLNSEFEIIRNRDKDNRTLDYNNWILNNNFEIIAKFKTFFKFNNIEVAKKCFNVIYGKDVSSKIKTNIINHNIVIFKYEKTE